MSPPQSPLRSSSPSTTASTSTSLTTSSPTQPSPPDLLDDVFGPSDDISQHNQHSLTISPLQPRHDDSHPSDLRRLESVHVTAGYRDGVASAREAAVQGGFDEGWMLGAALGIRAGEVWGIMEGIGAAFGSRDRAGEENTEEEGEVEKRLGRIGKEMKRELRVECLLGEEWMNEDGTWKWAVNGADEAVGMDRVAAEHPLIRKWSYVTEVWMKSLRVDREAVMASFEKNRS